MSVKKKQSTERLYTPDTIHHILRNKRRRAVLFYLKYNDSTVTMRELSREIAAWESNIEPEQVTSSQREPVYVSLHQTHLPTLDEHGVINYNKDRQTIQIDDGMNQFTQYVDPVNTQENIGSLIDEPRTVYAGIERDELDETRLNQVLQYLTPTIDRNEKWSTYYLCSAVIGGILIFLASPLTTLNFPMIVAAIIQTGLVLSLSFVHIFVEAEPEEVASAEEMFLGNLRPNWAEDND